VPQTCHSRSRSRAHPLGGPSWS